MSVILRAYNSTLHQRLVKNNCAVTTCHYATAEIHTLQHCCISYNALKVLDLFQLLHLIQPLHFYAGVPGVGSDIGQHLTYLEEQVSLLVWQELYAQHTCKRHQLQHTTVRHSFRTASHKWLCRTNSSMAMYADVRQSIPDKHWRCDAHTVHTGH